MIPHAEFRRAAWRHWSWAFALCASIVALGAFVFFVLWFILALVDPADSPEARAEYAMAVAIVVGLAAAIVAGRSAGQDASDDGSLSCPQCGAALRYYDAIIVLSSWNCPHCGDRVLDE